MAGDVEILCDMSLSVGTGERVGIVFQSFDLIPTMTALENVAAPLKLAGRCDALACGLAVGPVATLVVAAARSVLNVFAGLVFSPRPLRLRPRPACYRPRAENRQRPDRNPLNWHHLFPIFKREPSGARPAGCRVAIIR